MGRKSTKKFEAHDTGNAYASVVQGQKVNQEKNIFKSPLQKRLAGAVSKKFNSIDRRIGNNDSYIPDTRIISSSGVSTRNFFDKNISFQDMVLIQNGEGSVMTGQGVSTSIIKDFLNKLQNQKLDKNWSISEATVTIKKLLFPVGQNMQMQENQYEQNSKNQLLPNSSLKKLSQQQMQDQFYSIGQTLTIKKQSKKQLNKTEMNQNDLLPQLNKFLPYTNQGVDEEDEFACEATILAPKLVLQKVTTEYKTNFKKIHPKKRDLIDLLLNKKLLEVYGQNTKNIGGQKKGIHQKQQNLISDIERDPELIVERKHQNLFNKHRHWNDLIFAEDSNKIVWPRLCQVFQDLYKIDKIKISLMASQFQHIIFEDEVGINNQGNTFDEMSRKIYEKAQRLKDSNYNNRFEDKIKYLLLERSDKYHNIMSLQPLAMGAEAAVYRIKSYDRKELVAKCTLVDIKNVNKSEKQEKKAHQQFLHIIQETQLLALIKHPDYICRIEDEFITFDRQSEIIKEYVVVLEKANHSLSDILNLWNDRDIPNPANEHYCDEKLLYIIYRTMEAMEYLHQQSVYFGDMKPQNLLIFKDYMVKLGDFGISIKKDPYRQDSYQLRGVTEHYCTRETIFAFNNSKNFRFEELMELDKISLLLTIQRCLQSIKSFGKRNLFVEEVYQDLTEQSIRNTIDKWAKIFKINSQILQNLGRQFIKERRYEAMVKAYQLSKYCNIVFPPPPPFKNTDAQLEFQLNKWRELDLPNISFLKDKKNGRIKELNQNIEFKKIFMDCATYNKFPSPKLAKYEEETRKREYLYLLRNEIKELIMSDFYNNDFEEKKLTQLQIQPIIDNFCIDSRAYLLGLELKDEIPFDESKIKMLMIKVYQSQNFKNNEIYDEKKLSADNQLRISYIKYYFRALDLKKYESGIGRLLIIRIKPPTVLHPQAINYFRINKKARISLKLKAQRELQDIIDLNKFYETYAQQMQDHGKEDSTQQNEDQEPYYQNHRQQHQPNQEFQTKHQQYLYKMQQKPEVQYDIDVGQEYYPEYKFIIKYTKILEYFKSEQYYECYKESAAVLESWELVEFNKREMYMSEVNYYAAQCLINLKELNQIPKEMENITEEEYQVLVVQYYKYYSFSSDITLAKYIQYLKNTEDLDELIISFRRVIQIRKDITQQTTDLHIIEPKLLELDELQKKFEYFVRYWLKWSKSDAIQTLMMLPDPFTTDFSHMLNSIIEKFQQNQKQAQQKSSVQEHLSQQQVFKQKQLKQEKLKKQLKQ
eukprot:403350281